MEFRQAIQSDLDYVEANPLHRAAESKSPEEIDYCYALEDEGEILGIGGFRLVTNTTAWSWFILSKTAKNHLITVYRCLKEWTDIFCKEHRILRLQAFVAVDFPEGVRIADHLGFTIESIMRNFWPDKDAYLYVRFQGE